MLHPGVQPSVVSNKKPAAEVEVVNRVVWVREAYTPTRRIARQ